MDRLLQHFPDLSEQQRKQFAQLLPLYTEWNARINVISRRDMDEFYLHHVLHSLAIARVAHFPSGSRVLDVGTGGGFPGIPLAILFPDVNFTLVDSVGKKIRVADDVAHRLELNNCKAIQARVEQLEKHCCQYAVTRAVAALPQLATWLRGKLAPAAPGNPASALYALKGGDLKSELAPFGKQVQTWSVDSFFPYEYFESKQIVRLQLH